MKISTTHPAPTQPGTLIFLKDKTKRHLINNEWVSSENSDPFPTLDPATGETLAFIQSGTKADVDAAVSVARAAFESGEWASITASTRGKLLWKIAELIEANIDELAELETLDQGKRFSCSWVQGGKRV